MVVGLSGRLLRNCFTSSPRPVDWTVTIRLTKRERADREWRHMCKTWGSLLETGDPFYNPNLLFDWDYQEIPSTPRRRKPWHYIAEEISNLQQYFPLTGDGSTQKPGRWTAY